MASNVLHSMYVCMHVCMHVCTFATSVRTWLIHCRRYPAYVYVCMCVCVCMCMHVCLSVSMYVHLDTSKDVINSMPTIRCECMYVCVCMFCDKYKDLVDSLLAMSHFQKWSRTHTHTLYIYIYMRIYIHKYIYLRLLNPPYMQGWDDSTVGTRLWLLRFPIAHQPNAAPGRRSAYVVLHLCMYAQHLAVDLCVRGFTFVYVCACVTWKCVHASAWK